MLEVWGRPYSSNVIPVLWTVGELGLDYRLMLAGGSFGKLDTEAYAQINPNRMIPAIRDGDFALWESHAIVRYLCHRYDPGGLCPDDPQRRALADQWMDWSASRAFPPVIRLFFATVRTEPDERDPTIVARWAQEAADVLGLLDAHLAGRPYVAGDRFTMGDIPLGCVVYRWLNVEAERPALPHLAAWSERLAGRAAYRRHVMRFFGRTPDDWRALERESASEGVL